MRPPKGNVICDPLSREARALVGRQVLVDDTYTTIDRHPDMVPVRTLSEINPRRMQPFRDQYGLWYTFIRQA